MLMRFAREVIPANSMEGRFAGACASTTTIDACCTEIGSVLGGTRLLRRTTKTEADRLLIGNIGFMQTALTSMKAWARLHAPLCRAQRLRRHRLPHIPRP